MPSPSDTSYIREYSALTPQELRQLRFKRRYKVICPDWDDSMVKLTQLVQERLTNPSVVLDVGCGRGNFVIDELSEAFLEKIGFDVALEATEGNTTCDRICIGNGFPLPFATSSIDVAISLWVFEHLSDPTQTLSEVSRVLKPGGFFAFVTPNKRSVLITLRRILSEKMSHRLLHRVYGREEKDAFSVFYRANTTAQIKKLATSIGFVPEIIIENPDPSYTSFDPCTFYLSRLCTRFFGTLARPHLIVILRKQSS